MAQRGGRGGGLDDAGTTTGRQPAPRVHRRTRPLPGRTTEELPLTGLDEEAAVRYLLDRGVPDLVVARRIARQVGGSPMSLKLAAELVRQEGLTGGQLDIATREFLYIRVDDGVIQRQLYRRILGRIRNPDVKKIAHPGLVLRRLTPELILEALAVPCSLTISSLDEARALFEELKREVSLVTVASDGALEHRPDLRLLMLRLLEAEEPDRAQAIRELAVRHYKQRPPQPRERAEEIYLRLALGENTAAIDQRWIRGVERPLATVLQEFSGARYLQGHALAISPNINAKAYAQAVEYLTRAITLDPGYAQALAGLAFMHVFNFHNHWTGDPETALHHADEFAAKAIAAEPQRAVRLRCYCIGSGEPPAL